ncbi:hypothetical protein SLA2020_365210 [Shorea laevis]
MVSEEKAGRSALSWWWDSHNRSHQSEWLQTSLSDLDKKTKLMLSIIEDDGVSFAKRAEMFYKSRPELIKLVEDLHKSYRVLAQNYDQLKYSSSILPTPRPFISPVGSSNERGVVEKKINGVGNFGIMPDLERKKMWEDLQLEVTKLMEDHLRQQAELVRRNDEKREAIKELFFPDQEANG